MSRFSFFRILSDRRRLSAALLIGIAVGIIAPAPWTPVSRVLLGWNAGVYFYLVSMWLLMAKADEQHIRMLAQRLDETGAAVLLIVCLAAVASLMAIVLELAGAKDHGGSQAEMSGAIRLGLTAATVLGSWFLLPTVFALHYTHMFYMAPDAQRPVAFPEGKLKPDYWDFLYFSFTIAVASQTADVALTSHAMRKIVLAQAVLSFLFNTSVLALGINMAASLFG